MSTSFRNGNGSEEKDASVVIASNSGERLASTILTTSDIKILCPEALIKAKVFLILVIYSLTDNVPFFIKC